MRQNFLSKKDPASLALLASGPFEHRIQGIPVGLGLRLKPVQPWLFIHADMCGKKIQLLLNGIALLDQLASMKGQISRVGVEQVVPDENAGGVHIGSCLLYTSDAADERSSVDLG